MGVNVPEQSSPSGRELRSREGAERGTPPSYTPLNIWEEKSLSYDDSINNISGDVDLKINGYFQNIKYFIENQNEIRTVFKIENDIIDKYKRILNCLKKDNTRFIAIHIRMPDLNTESTDTFLYSFPTENFIKKSMCKFDLENDYFIFFSNDIARCITTYSNLPSKNIIFMGHEQSSWGTPPCTIREIEDLAFMSICDGYILSPSTFGWWGCFLNRNHPSSSIIMMKPWFNIKSHGEKENKYIDLYFENSLIYNVIEDDFERASGP